MAQRQVRGAEIQEGKIFAFAAYLWILCLVPLFFKKDNKFALFHAKQGLVLFIGEVAISIIGVIPIVGWLTFFLGSLVFGTLSLIGMIKALSGEYWRMPIVGEIAEKLDI